MPVAIVTGTSTGIGFATALHLARHGHQVVATMRNLAKAGPLETEPRLGRQTGGMLMTAALRCA